MRLAATLAIQTNDALGEVPMWDAARQRLIWSDIAAGVVHEAQADTAGGWREGRRWDVGRPVSAALPRADGRLIAVSGVEIVNIDEAGKVDMFARLDADPELVVFNDAKCDSSGRLWAGTSSKDLRSHHGCLYCIRPDGTLTRTLTNVTLSNGMAWSPDDSTFYYIDSSTRVVDAFDFDSGRGTIGNRRPIVTLSAGEGLFDGMTVDVEGCLWVAVAGAGEIRRYTPDGKLIGTVEVPTLFASSCAFGGADYTELFITTVKMSLHEHSLPILSAYGLNPATVNERNSYSGGLFVCRPGVAGCRSTLFAG